uniref:Uncharacterized protein n=1 Tax=Lygus hesperus TaxID=30085 RepID=A0A0A9YE23_LYGHE
MKLVAWLVAHNIELTQPDYYHCTIGVYNNLIRRDYFKYPQGLLSEMRIIKEALFKSLVDKIPIMEVHRRSAKRLNFFLNDLGEELKMHGKLVWSLSETIVGYQERELMRTCLIPPGPRVPDENTTNLDYLASEDYEPMQYLGF